MPGVTQIELYKAIDDYHRERELIQSQRRILDKQSEIAFHRFLDKTDNLNIKENQGVCF